MIKHCPDSTYILQFQNSIKRSSPVIRRLYVCTIQGCRGKGISTPTPIPFPQDFCGNPHGDPHMDLHMDMPIWISIWGSPQEKIIFPKLDKTFLACYSLIICMYILYLATVSGKLVSAPPPASNLAPARILSLLPLLS